MWFDRDIDISSTWTDEIAIAIINCDVFLVFLSKNSVDSAYVRSEIEYALNKKKKIIPVYLDGMSSLPPGLELGLNSTQGVTDVKNTEEITGEIESVLEFNGVKKNKNAGDETSKATEQGGDGKQKKRSLGAVIAVILAMVVYNIFMNRPSEVTPLVLEKTVFRPVETIFVVMPDMTDAVPGKNPIIGVSAADASHGSFISYTPVKENEATVKLRSPGEPGQYEIRFYKDDANLAESSMSGLGKFSVEGNASGVFGVSADKSEYMSGEEIVVSASGVPRQYVDERATIGLCKAGAPFGEYLVYDWIRDREYKTSFEAPKEPGEYEVRAYTNGDVWIQATLVSSIAVGVVSDDSDGYIDTPVSDSSVVTGAASDDADVHDDEASLDLPLVIGVVSEDSNVLIDASTLDLPD
jgi:hypothetical protein